MKFLACVPGELRFRDLVGTMVREVCRRVERDAACAGLEWRVVSAYNEAFNNIVEHAYGTAPSPGDVEVAFRVEEDRVELRLTDEGARFDLGLGDMTEAPADLPEVEALSEGGMGLFIMHQAMTEVRYERQNGRNLLTMVKLLGECTGPWEPSFVPGDLPGSASSGVSSGGSLAGTPGASSGVSPGLPGPADRADGVDHERETR